MDAISHLGCDRGRAHGDDQQHPRRIRRHLSGGGRRPPRGSCRSSGPKLLRVDLAAECRKLEDEMLGSEPPPLHARREIELRAYAVERGGRAGRAAALRARGSRTGERLFVERIRSRGRIFPGDKRLTLRAGDVVAISARRTTLVEALEQSGSGLRETDDKELLDLPGELLDVVVTNADDRRPDARGSRPGGAGARRVPQTHHTRGPTARALPGLRVFRGDVLTIGGASRRTSRGPRNIWAWPTARPTSPTCSSSRPASSQAR